MVPKRHMYLNRLSCIGLIYSFPSITVYYDDHLIADNRFTQMQTRAVLCLFSYECVNGKI